MPPRCLAPCPQSGGRDNIRVTVLDVSGNQIRLGVTAPREVPVHREEVAERIRAEAANSG